VGGIYHTPDERPSHVLPFYADDAVTIWHGNALDLPLEDESVDLICTSPPYWSLRSYRDGGEHYEGQVGSEETPGEFIDALAAATAEMARVLKPSGSIFVNLGDKYGPDKSLMLLPERYRIRCVDDLGLIARAVIVWDKPNGLPESVRDRVRRSHEDWVHLTKEPRYFTGIDEIREAHSDFLPDGRPSPRSRYADHKLPAESARTVALSSPERGDGGVMVGEARHPLGKLPGSVWRIPTQPLRVPPELGIDHFAAYPMEWPRRIIRGWSPAGICVECGEGRRPVGDREHTIEDLYPDAKVPGLNNRNRTEYRGRRSMSVTLTGYACACDAPIAPTRPAVILDPFSGTGTTGVVAKALGRQAHLVDLSRDYCRLAQWRVNDPAQLAKAAHVKPPAKRKAKVTKLPTRQPEQPSLLDDEPAA
jgi:DNA modification methylase